MGEIDKYPLQLPPIPWPFCPDGLRNTKSRGQVSNFVRSLFFSFFFSLSFVAIMGRDGFPFCGNTCCLGDGYTLQCSTSFLMWELLHLCQRLSSFFKNYFGSLYSSSFNLFGVSLVRGSSCSGDRLQRLLFTATSSPSVSQLPFSLLLYSLHRSCILSGWGAKGFTFTLFSSFW